jgi:hypothetical protein
MQYAGRAAYIDAAKAQDCFFLVCGGDLEVVNVCGEEEREGIAVVNEQI